MASWEEGEAHIRCCEATKLRVVQGISMTVEQYSALIAVMPEIESLLGQKGESVPRPNFDGAPQKGAARADDQDEDADVEEKRANIEATSDEEE